MGRSSISVRPVFVLILAAVATLLLALIIAPFAGSLFAGAVFAVVASPVQRRFSAWFGDRRSLAAGVVTALAALIVVAPLVWLSWSAAEQLGGVYRSVESAYYRGGLDAVAQEVPGPYKL